MPKKLFRLPVTLPEGVHPVVANGQTIKRGQPLSEPSTKKKTTTVAIAQKLAISPGEMVKSLRVDLGQTVSESTPLAEKGKVSVVSPIAGVIRLIDTLSGELVIESAEETATVIAPADGKISAIANSPNHPVTIDLETTGDELTADESIGDNPVWGDLLFLEPNSNSSWGKTGQTKSHYIAAMRADLHPALLAKGAALEAMGLIGTGFTTDECPQLARKLHLSILLIDPKKSSTIWDFLEKCRGCLTYLNPREKKLIVIQ
jgi:hypothetical protein